MINWKFWTKTKVIGGVQDCSAVMLYQMKDIFLQTMLLNTVHWIRKRESLETVSFMHIYKVALNGFGLILPLNFKLLHKTHTRMTLVHRKKCHFIGHAKA